MGITGLLTYCAHAQPTNASPMTDPIWSLDQSTTTYQRYSATINSTLPSGNPINDQFDIKLVLPNEPKENVPCVLILHYWGATDQRIEFNMAADLAQRGIASAILPLPYHLSRTPDGLRSGERAITPDPSELVRTMQQSIADVRQTIDLVQLRPEIRKDRFGITGTSLGSIVAALACGQDARITDAAFVVGGIDLAHVLWHSSRVVKERDALRRRGFTEDKLREALALIEPARYLAQQRPQNSYVVAAKFDTVIPPTDTDKLIDLLDKPHVLKLDTGHYGGFFVQKRVQASVADFFAKSFSGQAFVAPATISAPTIRLGVTMTGDDDAIQVGVGLDLWRPTSTDSAFATAVLSPQGAHLFVGQPLDRGLSIGLVFDAKRPKLGLFWSIVL